MPLYSSNEIEIVCLQRSVRLLCRLLTLLFMQHDAKNGFSESLDVKNTLNL